MKLTKRNVALALATAASAVFAQHALAGISYVSNATSYRTPGSAQEGAGDGSVPTIALTGSTALKNFFTSAGVTYLTPGTSITLGAGTAAQPSITYTAPLGAGVTFQLASSNFSNNDVVTGNNQTHSALRFEYHEAGSEEGVAELVDSQIDSGLFANPSLEYNPNLTQAVHINQSGTGTFFGGYSISNGQVVLNPVPTATNTPVSVRGFSLAYQASGARNPAALSLAQIAASDVAPDQVFSVSGGSGTVNPYLTPGTPGYGTGNPALGIVAPPETLGVADSRQSYFNVSTLNELAGTPNPNYVAGNPNTGDGANYSSGPWNSAGLGNLNSTIVAQTATVFAANPGTGLTHINRTDAQFLLATGRLANGAAFDVATRDPGSGTRNMSALNVGIDPTYAVGVNDNGNGNDSSVANGGGTAQVSIGSAIRFSNKTSGGSGLRPTIQNARMGLGTLGMSDAIGSVKSNSVASPLRALGYRDDANDIQDNSNGSTWNNWSEDGSGNSLNLNASQTQGDLASGTFIQPNAKTITDGSYVLYQNEQFVTAKVPTAAEYSNPDDYKGDDTGNDVYKFVNNITSAVANSPLPNNVSVANPADELLATSFIIPQYMAVDKTGDGLNASSQNSSYDVTDRNSNFVNNSSVAAGFNTADPATITTGASSFYGNGAGYANHSNVWDPTLNSGAGGFRSPVGGDIAITSNNTFFGDFNQNDPTFTALTGLSSHAGDRDLSSVEHALGWAKALYNSGLGTNWDVNAGSNSSTAITAPADNTLNFTPTKGDLIVKGDFGATGDFNGMSLYDLAHNSAMSDSPTANATAFADGYLTPSSATPGSTGADAGFADWVRNGVLRKNTALQYMQTNTADASSSAAPGTDAAASYYIRMSARTAYQVELGTNTDGSMSFNNLDVDHKGLIDLNTAAIVDKFSGYDYTNLTQSLSATINQGPTSVSIPDGDLRSTATNQYYQTGTQIPFDLVDAKLSDNDGTVIDRNDFNLVAAALGSSLVKGDADFSGTVDFADVQIVLSNYGATTSRWGQGNFENDATVDLPDLKDAVNNYDGTTPLHQELTPTYLYTVSGAGAVGLQQAGAIAGFGQWGKSTGGSAQTSGNWTGSIPNAQGAYATFGSGLTANGTVTLDANTTVGVVVFNNAAASYTIAAGSPAGTLTIDNTNGLYGTTPGITVTAGSHSITAPIALLAQGMTVNTAASTAISLGVIGGSGNLSFTGSGHATLTAPLGAGSSNFSGNTSVSGAGDLVTLAQSTAVHTSQSLGTLSIGAGSEVAVPFSSGDSTGTTDTNHQAIVVNALNFSGSSGAWQGLLDLGDNDMIIHYGSFSAAEAALATIQNQIDAGRNQVGGANAPWNGTTGITSSAAADVFTATSGEGAALGYAVNSSAQGAGIVGDLATGTFSSFDGVAVSTGDMLIKYTHMADGQLNGYANLNSLTVLAGNYLATGHFYWSDGDYNGDGKVDLTDVTLLAGAYLQTGDVHVTASLAPAFAPAFIPAVTAVPEPTSLGLLALGAVGLLGKRRRK